MPFLSLKKRLSFFSLLSIFALSSLFLLSKTGCAEPQGPPPLLPEVDIQPNSWTITENIPAGLKRYKKFTIRNKVEKLPNSESLEVTSIKLDDKTSKQFRLISDQCPLGSDQNECVAFPSLPFKLAPGETRTFSAEFTASNSTELQAGKILLVTNGKNPNDNPTRTDSITLQTRGGEPLIDLSLPVVTDTEFRLSFKPTEKDKPTKESVIITNATLNGTLEFSFAWETEDPNKNFSILAKGAPVEMGKKFTLIPNDNLEFEFIYQPTSCGENKAKLRIESNSVFRAWDEPNGQTPAGPVLFINLEGRTPAKAEIDPAIVTFSNVPVGQTEIKTFTIQPATTSLCDLIVNDIQVGPQQGAPAPPETLSIEGMKKGGQPIAAATPAKPIVLKKGEVLTVEIKFAPKKQGSEEGVIIIDTNDKDLDPKLTGVISVSAGTEIDLPPRANFDILCGEDASPVCKKGDNLGSAVSLGAETKVRVDLDSSRSTDREGPIASYLWEIEVPPGSSTKLSEAQKIEAKPSVLFDTKGKYRITLTVKDAKGQSNKLTREITLNN